MKCKYIEDCGGAFFCLQWAHNIKYDFHTNPTMDHSLLHTHAVPADMNQAADAASSLLKIIAHPHRLMILCLLLEGDKNVTELTEKVGISQTAMSNHLAKLRSEHIVDFTRHHRSLVYRLTSHEVTHLITALYELYCEK